jgi:hypothetical protein
MLDVSEQRARADQQLLNAIAKRVELERELRQNPDQMQLGALKENICSAGGETCARCRAHPRG